MNTYDVVIVGGGINGSAIARDAAGRGLSVALVEKDDLASATSSASTKLIHGGLRYLEHKEFNLVRKALNERAILLNTAPHIIWPMRFVLPHTPHLRPFSLIRFGLFIYDHLGKRHKQLPRSKGYHFKHDSSLKPSFKKGFIYSDCWVQDSRLVVLNAMDAKEKGADIFTHTEVTQAHRENDVWNITLKSHEGEKHIQSQHLINATGPWAESFLNDHVDGAKSTPMRLVKGSHIVVKKLFDHEYAYIFQHDDGRVIFAIPYEDDYTLIGTTDVEVSAADSPTCSESEKDYLCNAVNYYFNRQLSVHDIIWDYSGIRPLIDDSADDAMSVSRDYVLDLQEKGSTTLLNVYGGKITTSRKLAQKATNMLFPNTSPWTENSALPGGDFKHFDTLLDTYLTEYPNLPKALITRYVRNYGTRTSILLRDAVSLSDLGKEISPELYEREISYLKEHEFATTMEDILWRRTKLGIRTL